MNSSAAACLTLALALLLGGCATPIPAPDPASMVSKMLDAGMIGPTRLFIDKPVLDSAAKSEKAPFDEITGTFPFVQPRGLESYRKGMRLALKAAGAAISDRRADAEYVLRSIVLGGMTIPFPEAYSILFVRYEIEDPATGDLLWSKNVYSQAKLERIGREMEDDRSVDPAYGRLAAANLRQLVNSLSTWMAECRGRCGI